MKFRRDDSTAILAVTGLTGFIGNRVREIAAGNFPVVPLDLSASSAPAAADNADEGEAGAGRALIHLAGPTGQSRVGGEEETIRRSNVDLAERVTSELARRAYSRLVFVSTGALEMDKRSRVQQSGYARGKAEAEQVLARAAQQHGIPLIVLRPTRVVGPGDRRQSLLALMRWISRGKPVPVAEDSWANFVSVDDVAAAILRAGSGRLPGGVYAVNEPVRWRDFLEIIASSLAVRVRSLRVPSPLLAMSARVLAAAGVSRLRLIAGRLEELAGAAPIRCEALVAAWPEFPEAGLRRGLPILAADYRSRGLL